MHTDWEPRLPSTLYRQVDGGPGSDRAGRREEIGSGPLFKMVRIALSDPDAEVWRYSIAVDGEIVAGEGIRGISRILNG